MRPVPYLFGTSARLRCVNLQPRCDPSCDLSRDLVAGCCDLCATLRNPSAIASRPLFDFFAAFRGLSEPLFDLCSNTVRRRFDLFATLCARVCDLFAVDLRPLCECVGLRRRATLTELLCDAVCDILFVDLSSDPLPIPLGPAAAPSFCDFYATAYQRVAASLPYFANQFV